MVISSELQNCRCPVKGQQLYFISLTGYKDEIHNDVLFLILNFEDGIVN